MDALFRAELNRRQMLAASFGGIVAATFGKTGSAAPKNLNKPNILFLMSDQHRGDCVGADGNPLIHTPNLDRIANQGATCSSAYSTTPTCTPARAGLLTGLSPWRHGMLGYFKVAEKYPNEMPRMLRDNGYYTFVIGKLHYTPQRNLHGYHSGLLDESSREQSIDFRSDYRSWFYSVAPTKNPDVTGIGFNDFDGGPYQLPAELHPTHWTGEAAVRFLENYQGDQPFFLKVSFARPHSPYDPPQKWWDFYQDRDLPAAAVGEWADRNEEQQPQGALDLWRGDLGAEQVRKSRQGYYGSVSFIDEQIGRILDALEARGELENTLIVYTSDHGDMTGDHHLWRKGYPYEASARVPMLVRWPTGMGTDQRGVTWHQPTELRDILPTFLDAAGVDANPADFDGNSLLNLARGKTDDWREYIDLEHDICYRPWIHWSGLTDGKKKYIFHTLDGEQQLFDLEQDPHELKNLASLPEHADELRKWRGRMVDHFQVRGEPFLKNGDLALRPTSQKLSPNYPGNNLNISG
ncbi:MAG: arylsulfatase [Planctomycetaceae bacterium]